MTDDRSLERAARSWLENGPTQAPDRAVEAALLRIETTAQERDWHVPWRLPKMTTTVRVATAAILGVLVVGGALLMFGRPGQSGVGGPGPSPTPSTSTFVPSGTWATGPIPIESIRSSMIAAGITAAEADAWIADNGSPTRYSFELAFDGNAFEHSEETPDMAMQVGESGTFALTGTRLVLTMGEPGSIDTYTFEATVVGDELSLRWVDSTDHGSVADKAMHRRFAIAFYSSAPFRRQP
jgi:hypothetical protein